MPLTNSPNHFLSSLSAQDRDLLQPHLKQLQLPQGTALYRADDTISNVYFPHFATLQSYFRHAPPGWAHTRIWLSYR